MRKQWREVNRSFTFWLLVQPDAKSVITSCEAEIKSIRRSQDRQQVLQISQEPMRSLMQTPHLRF